MQGYWNLTLSAEGTQQKIIIYKGNFQGDVDLAIKEIKRFCDNHQMKIQEHFYGDYLTIDGKKFWTNRFGLNIETMLDFCDIDLSTPSYSRVRLSNFTYCLFPHPPVSNTNEELRRQDLINKSDNDCFPKAG